MRGAGGIKVSWLLIRPQRLRNRMSRTHPLTTPLPPSRPLIPAYSILPRMAAALACGVVSLAAGGLSALGNGADWLLMATPLGPRLLGVPDEQVESHRLSDLLASSQRFNRERAAVFCPAFCDTQKALARAAAEEAAASSKTRGYSYVVFHFLFVTVTRRSLRLATSAAATCLLALQGSSLVLTTTPAEDAALALCTLPSWRLKRWNRRRKKKGEEEGNEDDETDSSSSSSPFEVVRRPANRTALTLLLSRRFLALVFDEARGLALSLAARGIDWEGLGSGGGISVGLRLVTRLFGNLQARAGDVAVAMTARGFAGPGLHIVHPAPVSEGGGGREGDGSATKRRSARVSFGATLGAVLLACAALARAAVSSPA